ncbi:unnamed protein product [Rotaria socialis]|uniref:Transient receptor potential cation channel subfamily A member 1 n=2 Tax=Rotaria socialis TaxID=392032 RepID=A0A818ZG37_9BILA|nr:unnamed protein product [Rotaria socialis]
MMDVHENQQNLISNVSKLDIDEENPTEVTPLTNAKVNEEEEVVPFMIPEPYDWTTSLLSQICREGDIHRLRLFIEFSRQTSICAQVASNIIGQLDVDTGLSPLHHAARHQQLNVCVMLLSNIELVSGVNIKDEHGRTPMYSAFRLSNHTLNTANEVLSENDFGTQFQDSETWQQEYNHTILSSHHPIIYLFARTNGDVNVRDKYLLTLLHYAVARQNLAGVKQLIALNADIESRDRQGIRPLHIACKEGYFSIVEYLIEQGAKLDAVDADSWTPIHYACAKGHLDIVKLTYLKHESYFKEILLMKTNNDATCFHLVVESGNVLLVKYLLTKFTRDNIKLLINEQVEPFGTPLHIAAKICDPSMIRLLYDYGADPSLLNSNKQSPLHIACASNRLSNVQEFYNLTQLSLLEIKDRRGRTALSVTTQPDIIDQLITFGSDISSTDHDQMNAIMIAVSTGQISIVNRLLSVFDHQFLPILDHVESKHQRSIFLIAIQTGSIDMCSLLLTQPCIRWDTIDKQRMNAFHIAAQNNHYELITLLCNHIQQSTRLQTMNSRSNSITATIDSNQSNLQQTSSFLRLYIDAQNQDGKTPLHLAAEQGHLSCIEILLKHSANVLLESYLGQLPLHVAIQHGHGACVYVLINACTNCMREFQSILSRKQLPLIVTACRYGFADIVKVLISNNIGIDYDMNLNCNEDEENPLEIGIKYRQNETVHLLLEHSSSEQWLTSIRNSHENVHQTPLRDLIRYMPDCAQHTLDKLIVKTNEIDLLGNRFQRTTYKYRYLDDYFIDNNKLYTKSSHQLYRNHPLIIALDNEHHGLLEHPLAQQLMKRKWKLYRPFFYFPRILSFLLLLVSTFYALMMPAPNIKASSNSVSLSITIAIATRWIIVVLSIINLLKIFLEIILFRGFRVLFAQLFGLVTFLSTTIAFTPFKSTTDEFISWQWQLTAFSVLIQWFNIAVMHRSVPILGQFFVMVESVSIKFIFLLFVTCPLLIAFTISVKMLFFNHPAFATVVNAIHKSSTMITGEFDYETLFFSKSTFTAAAFLFIPFIVIMPIVFMNLLLGITIGDIQGSMERARTKANAYWIRELIYIESTLPSKTWLKHNIVEYSSDDNYINNSIENKAHNQDENENESLTNQPHIVELGKLVDILDFLCTQTKQILDYEINLEQTVKQLLTIRKAQDSHRTISNRSSSV